MIDMKKLRKTAENAATAGRGTWESDRERQGDAPFLHYEFFVIDGDGNRMFGSENADAGFGCIEREDDEHGFTFSWNEPARRVIEHTVAFQPSTCLALLDRIDKLEDLLKRAKMAAKPFIRVWTKGDNPTRATLIVAWDHVERIADVSAKIKEALDDRPV